MQAKQQAGPLQTNEVANIRRKTARFDVEQYTFRENFRKEAPFLYDSTTPYKKLDDVIEKKNVLSFHLSFILYILN